MNKKLKVLFVGEFSQLSTGFSTIARYVLPRLQKNTNLSIAEHASYINAYHHEIDKCEWAVFPNEPDPNNPKEIEAYKRDRTNQFGKWKFEEVCLAFQPDIVVSFRDIWMDMHIFQSPYRKYFKYIHMPTCDGEPQKSEWVSTYKTADSILTYSLFAKYQLEKYSGGDIKVFDVASPGADTDIFKPMDKTVLRSEIGLQDDLIILGTVMRNQPRKLYPELLRMFGEFLELCRKNGNHEVARKTYMYWHTSYPDLGWDIPYELRRYNLSHKVMFTYMCDQCQHVWPSFFAGDVCICKNCKNRTGRMPNTASGVSREALAKIMNLFDMYIQYSCSEGFGMPINDAKACGVPVMVVDHSAMSEQAMTGGGFLIPTEKHFQEPASQTNQLRSLPDNTEAALIFYNYCLSSKEKKAELSKEARECIEKYYTWDHAADTFERAILDVGVPEYSWSSPPNIIKPNLNIPDKLNHEQFLCYVYDHVLCEPNKKYDEQFKKSLAALNIGYELSHNEEGHTMRHPVDRNIVINNILNYVNYKNNLEAHRYNRCGPQTPESKISGGQKILCVEI